jgi:hypothetical protein
MVISWSFLKAFEQCPLQQKLIRIDKVVPKKIDERRFIAGAVGHRFFEVWAERVLYIMSKRKYIVWRGKSDYEKVKERVVKEADMIIESVHHHEIDKLSNLQVEKFFSKPLPCNHKQHSVAGKIDVVAKNGVWLLEMKMSAEAKWQDPDQLIFYGLLIGAIKRRYLSMMVGEAAFFVGIIQSKWQQGGFEFGLVKRHIGDLKIIKKPKDS